MSKPLDHVDMIAHCGLGVVVTIIGVALASASMIIYFPGDWEMMGLTATISIAPSSWMAALVIVYREVIQGSMWCTCEELMDQHGNRKQKAAKHYRAGRGLNFSEWGRQKHYETWTPAALVVLSGTIIGIWLVH